jgi:hypothetical protein
MVRILTNTFKPHLGTLSLGRNGFEKDSTVQAENISSKAKMMAWWVFLIIFIDNGTLGIFPQQLYLLYRGVFLSDILIYALIIYTFFHLDEIRKEMNSKLMIVVKFLLFFFLAMFFISVILYKADPVEYFFRLKNTWCSFLVFPYLLLMKRNGMIYLFKIMLPFAVLCNVLYILTAVTGMHFLRDTYIVKTTFEGGVKLYRVFGSTFYGEVYFLCFIYLWLTKKFRVYQLGLAILFVTPHILALGRAAWVNLAFSIFIILFWNFWRKRNFRVIFKEIVVFGILSLTLIYVFIKFIPESDIVIAGLEARFAQGEEDYSYKEGSFGTRLDKIGVLVDLWRNSNILFGTGMHPMWVIKPETSEEAEYLNAFYEIRWAGVLVEYGAFGLLLAIIFQIVFIVSCFQISRKSKNPDIYIFLILFLLAELLFDSVINYTYNLITLNIWGLSYFFSFFVAATVYKYENPESINSIA